MPKPKTAAPPAQVVAATAAPSGGVKKISLAGFAKKSATTGKVYPVLPDPDGQVSEIVELVLTQADELDALTASLDLHKAELRALASPFFFSSHHGRSEIASSIECRATDGRQVTVQFQNRYKAAPDDAAIVALLGARAAQYFRQSFTLKIDGTKIPEAAVEPLLGELQELFARHGAGDALTATQGIAPTKDFHTARHTLLSVEENAALERVCPIITAVKTKGRGEDK